MDLITPCLWFDGDAEAAATFYTDLFADSRILEVGRNTESTPGETGSAMIVVFELGGRRFTGLNGGPQFPFTEAVSMMIDCSGQAEIDRYWEALTADGGEPGVCGWCKDRFGLSWQVVPRRFTEIMSEADAATADRVMAAIMDMRKIDLAEIERAAAPA